MSKSGVLLILVIGFGGFLVNKLITLKSAIFKFEIYLGKVTKSKDRFCGNSIRSEFCGFKF